LNSVALGRTFRWLVRGEESSSEQTSDLHR